MTDQVTDAPAEGNEAEAAAAAAASEAEKAAAGAEDLLGEETPEDEKSEGEKGEKAEAEKTDGKADGEKVDGAPETYEPFVLPEGVERDETGLEAFGVLAKELDLNQETAQKFIDLQAEIVQRNNDAAWQVWADKQNEWAGEVRNDKELGGENFEMSKAAAKAFVHKFGGEDAKEVIEALKLTGASNHPAVFRVLARAGRELAEDAIVSGGQGGDAPVERAKVLFPDMN
jgi:hypothetical protein